MPPRSDTQALRLIASIPLIQRRKKYHSRDDYHVIYLDVPFYDVYLVLVQLELVEQPVLVLELA